MLKYVKFTIGLTALCLLSSCDKAKNILGLARQSNNEFNVIEKPPLSFPNNYNLVPPQNEGKAKNVRKAKLPKDMSQYNSILQKMDKK